MALKLPHVNVIISDAKGFDSQGELSTLSIGFGIHQAWIYAAMFGTSSLFNTQELFPVAIHSITSTSITGFFMASIVAFFIALLFMGITDQKYLRYYTSKSVLRAAAIATSAATFVLFVSDAPGGIGLAVSIATGIVSGIGSATLVIFWGTAFARISPSGIVLNAVIAVIIAMVVYATLLYAVPSPFAGVIVALLPLLELPFLWRKTPVSYVLRHAVPIFNPLPVKKGFFSLRFGFPVLLVGFALGMLRSLSTQVILPSPDLSINALVVVAACIAVCVIVAIMLLAGMHRYWDTMLRIVVPLVLISFCFTPVLSAGNNSIAAGVVLIAGYMLLESFMWIFFGQLCQTFRLSAVLIFGIGRGMLALGAFIGSMACADATFLDSLTPFGPNSGVLLYMAALVIAYIFLPRVRDIKHMIDPDFEHRHSIIDDINNEITELDAIVADQPNDEDPNDSAYTEDEVSLPMEAAAASNNQGEPANSATAGKAAPAPAKAKPNKQPEGDGSTKAATSSGKPASATVGSTGASPAETGSAEASSAASDAEGDDAQATKRKSGRFRTQCETIADRHLLSRRETEVLFLLAKGYNAAYIQKKLYITQSTAKTHIYHIYQKLGIHTQQELLSMVSDEMEEKNA